MRLFIPVAPLAKESEMPSNQPDFIDETYTMHTQFNPLSPSIEFLRNLSATTLAGSEEVIFWQIDHAQQFIGRSTKQLRASLSKVATVEKPENWPAVVESGVRSALETSRELAISAADFNLETYNFLQKQTIDAQKALAETWSEQFALFQAQVPHGKHPTKHMTAQHRAAA
jgi:hypothetical protein